MGKTWANCSRFAKFTKVFSCHCFVLYVTTKLIKDQSPISCNYFVGSHLASWIQKIKYFGIYICDSQGGLAYRLSPKLLLTRTAFVVLCMALHQLYRPISVLLLRLCIEYACQMWSPYANKNIDLFESV